jgi:hypothetical protein
VLLVAFIAAVIGIPASVVAMVQLVRRVVRKITRERPETAILKSSIDLDPVDAANLSAVLSRKREEWESPPSPDLQATRREWQIYRSTERPYG